MRTFCEWGSLYFDVFTIAELNFFHIPRSGGLQDACFLLLGEPFHRAVVGVLRLAAVMPTKERSLVDRRAPKNVGSFFNAEMCQV